MLLILKFVETLFPSLVRYWRMNGLKHGVVPLNQRHLTVAGFGTRKYVAPCHVEIGSNEGLRTVGLRFYRGQNESKVAHQFCEPELQNIHSDVSGLVIEQPDGAFTLWKAYLDLHGSSVDPRIQKPK